MPSPKICPMKFNSNTLDRDGEHSTVTCLCEQDRCAWFDQATQSCAVPLIAHVLRHDQVSISGTIETISG